LIADRDGWYKAYAAETATSFEMTAEVNELTQKMISIAEETQLNEALFGHHKTQSHSSHHIIDDVKSGHPTSRFLTDDQR
jgi:hypothetical protein